MPAALYPSSDLVCLAKAIYHEARGEPFEGRVAVAQIVLNRARKSHESLCGVISKGIERGEKCQFSFACRYNVLPPAQDSRWLDAKWLAEETAAGRAYLRELEHAEHYHTVDVRPVWRLGLTPIRMIGRHVFYNPPGVKPDLSVAEEVSYRWDEAAEVEIIADPGVSSGDKPSAMALIPTSSQGPHGDRRQAAQGKQQHLHGVSDRRHERFLPFSDIGSVR